MLENDYFQKLFTYALGISEPWKITSIDMERDEEGGREEMHIRVDFEEGSLFGYGGESLKAYDSHERTWRHMNFFQYRCYITARVPRVRTGDGKVRTVDVPWAHSGSGFTLMMEGVILTLVKHMPVRAVAREIGEHDTRIWRVVGRHVEEALELQDFSDVTGIGVDEYSHRGHDYITVFLSHPDVEVDRDGRRRQTGKPRVLFVAEGKDMSVVKEFAERFDRKRGKREEVKVATSDMVHGFRSAMHEEFGDAVVTVDVFHVVKNCQEAVDNVRKREMASGEARKRKALARTRYLWLRNGDDLTEAQRRRLDELLQIDYLDTVKAYDMRLRLQEFYRSHKAYDSGTAYDFEEMALSFCNSTIMEMRKFGQLLTRNAVEILNYFETFRTNAILEGFNSKISIIKNRARGFRNLRNFISMIYFCCGELCIPFAPIM